MNIPVIDDSLFTIFEKSARHHHDNTEEELPETDFQLLFNVQPEKLGVRIRIAEETRSGSVIADAAVLYYWDRKVTRRDDLDQFVSQVAIPQVLAGASALLIDAAGLVGADVAFYGNEAREKLVEEFRERSMKLTSHLPK